MIEPPCLPSNLRPNIHWINLTKLRPEWVSPGRTFHFSPAAVISLHDSLTSARMAAGKFIPIFFKKATALLAELPSPESTENMIFAKADVDVVGKRCELNLGVHFDGPSERYFSAAYDWVEENQTMETTSETVDAWLARGALAHDRLLSLSARATDKQLSAYLVDVVLLLGRAQLNPKACEASNTQGWIREQLDFLWLNFAIKKPRNWAWEATQLFARVSGPTLVDFRHQVAASAFQKDTGADLAALMLAEQEGTLRRSTEGRYIPVPDSPPEALTAKNKPPPFHRSQRLAFERCVALAKLHFSGILSSNPLQPRTSVLLVGSTGSGKSFVAREVAKALGAHFINLTFGRWIPFGVRDSRPTPITILEAAREHERVVVFIDEIDKCFSTRGTGEWGKSVMTELYGVLERQFPMEEFASFERAEAKRAGENTKAVKFEPPDVNRIWFLAAGTWQELTGGSPRHRKIGFGGGEKNDLATDESVLDQVRASDIIPLELLARFHAQPLLLRYPTPDEIPALIQAYGLDALAAQANVDLSEAKFDFANGGMRIFEAIAADLGLKILARKEAQEANHER